MAAIGSLDQYVNASVSQLQGYSVQDYFSTVQPLVIFIAGITLYAVFIFKFYKFLAKRDMLELQLSQYTGGFGGFLAEMAKVLFHWIESLIIIPLLIFFWFIVLAAFLLVMGKGQAAGSILLTSASLVAAVRVTAYYSEELSRDLAKMIPFALLGIFLIDSSYFTVGGALETIKEIGGLITSLVSYLIFIVILEFILRTIHAARGVIKR